MLEVLSVEPFDRGELLARLARTRLRGFGKAQVYADAKLELAPTTDTSALTPAQRYVLAPTIARLLELRAALAPWGIDPFALDGGAHIRTSDDPEETIPLIPPIVERSSESDGRQVLLIGDGLHRVSAARSVGLPISVVIVTNISSIHPYYAQALPNGWSDLDQLDELPDSFQKKSYRLPACYKALFRDFNAVFPGVQQQRKRSNPSHLHA
jgi:hypothetical protein